MLGLDSSFNALLPNCLPKIVTIMLALYFG